MKSNALTSEKSKRQTSLIDQTCQNLLLNRLEKIYWGSITLIDQNQLFHFGTKSPDSLHVTLTVYQAEFYRQVVFGGSVGAGEAYFNGLWDSSDLTLLVRILLKNREVLDGLDSGLARLMLPFNRVFHWFNRNNKQGSRKNIAAHYDRGNELFMHMLDSKMMYSSAIYPAPDASLETAAEFKLKTLCQKLKLKKSDHLLEIGTGWGGMALYAAQNYGCKVTTTTISRQQYNYTRQRITEEGLERQITLLFKDYRDLQGQYDKLVSIEMIEAVGLSNLSTYFKKCSDLLKADGLMALQAITIADQRFDQAAREVDFIQKYIFPGGSLPSVEVISQKVARSTDMVINDLHNIGIHYAQTLKDWRKRFFASESRMRKLGYSSEFIRMWEFYLCYCEGGFREGAINTLQVVLSKPEFRSELTESKEQL